MRIPGWIRTLGWPLLGPGKPEMRTIIVGGLRGPRRRGKAKYDTLPEAHADVRPQTTGEIKRELDISPGRPEKIEVEIKSIAPVLGPKEGAVNDFWRWGWLHEWLKEAGYVRIGPNQHMGDLRGVDILKAARREFRRAGIPVRVQLCGNHGFIELEGCE